MWRVILDTGEEKPFADKHSAQAFAIYYAAAKKMLEVVTYEDEKRVFIRRAYEDKTSDLNYS